MIVSVSLDEYRVEWPTLFVALDWIESHCVVPDGFEQGEPFLLAEWQSWFVANHYRVKPSAPVDNWRLKRPVLAPAFHNRLSQLVMPQKAGKGPLTAAQVCLEGVGPALFAGWASGGERWDCRDHGCGCGWVYEYEPHEAMGMTWPTPLIQITATSVEQTDNVYDALRPMIDKGPLAELVPKTGEEFIRLPNGGRIDTVTSSARSRLGQRVTFVPQDEVGIWTPDTGMVKVADTQMRGLAGMGGRATQTTNGWDPTQHSVAQVTAESGDADVFRLHVLPGRKLDYEDAEQRRKIHAQVYAGCPWVNLDAINAEADSLFKRDPAQAERFFGNRIVAGGGVAFDLDEYDKRRADNTIPDGAAITAGFDGSKYDDSTGIIITEVSTGLQVVWAAWEDDGSGTWEVPEAEVDASVQALFSTYKVKRMYGDPPYWQDWLAKWQGEHAEVAPWWTTRDKAMAWAIRRWWEAVVDGAQSHDGDDRLRTHVGNCRRRSTRIRDDKGKFMWTVQKDRDHSPNKIDLTVAAVLSWEARSDVIAEGALKPTVQHRAVGFGGRRRR